MNLYSLIKPLGIATYGFLLFTVVSGLLRWKLASHKKLAITALALATAHAALVIFL